MKLLSLFRKQPASNPAQMRRTSGSAGQTSTASSGSSASDVPNAGGGGEQIKLSPEAIARGAKIRAAEPLMAQGDAKRRDGHKNLLKSGACLALGAAGFLLGPVVGYCTMALGSAGATYFANEAKNDYDAGAALHDKGYAILTADNPPAPTELHHEQPFAPFYPSAQNGDPAPKPQSPGPQEEVPYHFAGMVPK